MNLFTPIYTETRLDVNGVPYEAITFTKPKKELAYDWGPDRDLTGGSQPINQSWLQREADKQLREAEL